MAASLQVCALEDASIDDLMKLIEEGPGVDSSRPEAAYPQLFLATAPSLHLPESVLSTWLTWGLPRWGICRLPGPGSSEGLGLPAPCQADFERINVLLFVFFSFVCLCVCVLCVFVLCLLYLLFLGVFVGVFLFV